MNWNQASWQQVATMHEIFITIPSFLNEGHLTAQEGMQLPVHEIE